LSFKDGSQVVDLVKLNPRGGNIEIIPGHSPCIRKLNKKKA